MRKKSTYRINQRKMNKIYTIAFILLILIQCSTILNASNEDDGLIIEINPKTIISGSNFSISVYDPNIKNGTPYLVNVTIEFNNNFYEITPESETGEIIIAAPTVLFNTSYTIYAYAPYKTANTSIIIQPLPDDSTNELIITITTYTLIAENSFTVIVTDQTGKPIENVQISLLISSGAIEQVQTDSEGRAQLTAPNEESIVIYAQKQGYQDDYKKTDVRIKHELIDYIITHKYTPIAIAVLILISSILYVSVLRPHIKKKPRIKTLKTEQPKTTKITKPQKQPPSPKIETKKEPTPAKPIDSKIEEIHIKSKQPTEQPISLQQKTVEPKTEQPKTTGHQWFKHSKEPDKETQKSFSPQEKKPKEQWFEGTNDIQKKIDKKLKEKDEQNK